MLILNRVMSVVKVVQLCLRVLLSISTLRRRPQSLISRPPTALVGSSVGPSGWNSVNVDSGVYLPLCGPSYLTLY